MPLGPIGSDWIMDMSFSELVEPSLFHNHFGFRENFKISELYNFGGNIISFPILVQQVVPCDRCIGLSRTNNIPGKAFVANRISFRFTFTIRNNCVGTRTAGRVWA